MRMAIPPVQSQVSLYFGPWGECAIVAVNAEARRVCRRHMTATPAQTSGH
jgi:hypothetical protein